MSFINSIRIIIRFFVIIFKVNPKIVISNLILRLFSAVIPLASLWIGKLIIDALTNHQSFQSIVILVVVDAILAIYILQSNRIISFFDELVNQEFSINISALIIRHANRFSLEELEDAEFYNLLNRAVDETDNASEVVKHILEDIELLISIIVYSIAIFLYNVWILFIFIISIIPSVIGEYRFFKKFYILRRSWTDNRREIDYLTWLSTTDTNLKEIKVYDTSDYLIDKLTLKKKTYFKLEKTLGKSRLIQCGALRTISQLCYYLAYIYVIRDTFLGAITIGTMVYLSGSLANINTFFTRFFSSITWLSHKSMYINDFFIFLDKTPLQKLTQRRKLLLEEVKDSIELINVGYKYPNSNRWALRHINLKILVGEKIAVLGGNGSGKTTLLKILTGLYHPTEGKILIDGVDTSSYEDYTHLFGIIFQDFIKYEFDVKENICISNIRDIDNSSDMDKCAMKSGALDFINHLPLRYSQVLSNRFRNGIQISGGEWQKIALARAMFSNKPFLILDEPSASLDIMAEKLLFENLLTNYSEDDSRTLILVSHRLSHLDKIERIIVLDDGQIVEEGNHNTLMNNNQIYKKMYNVFYRK